MNKSQLIDALSAHYDGNKRAAQHALESVVDTIMREVARGEKVAITGFGAFEKAVRPSRMVRNPATGERVRAKKTAIPKFRAGSQLKEVVSGARKLPKLTVSKAAGTASRAAGTATAKKTAAKKSAAQKTSAQKSAAKKASTTKKASAKKAPAKSAAAKKSTTAKKSPAKQSTSASTAKKASAAKKTSAAKKGAAKKTSAAKKGAAKKTSAAKKS